MNDREIYLMPRITAADFPQLQQLMAGEDDFPVDFGGWQNLWERRRREEELERGYQVVFVDVPVAGFGKFCRDRGALPGWAWLGKYIAELAARA